MAKRWYGPAAEAGRKRRLEEKKGGRPAYQRTENAAFVIGKNAVYRRATDGQLEKLPLPLAIALVEREKGDPRTVFTKKQLRSVGWKRKEEVEGGQGTGDASGEVRGPAVGAADGEGDQREAGDAGGPGDPGQL